MGWQAGFEALAEHIQDGHEALDLMFAFWEKLQRLEMSYAKGIDDLCNSRAAKLHRLFRTTASAEPNRYRPLNRPWPTRPFPLFPPPPFPPSAFRSRGGQPLLPLPVAHTWGPQGRVRVGAVPAASSHLRADQRLGRGLDRCC